MEHFAGFGDHSFIQFLEIGCLSSERFGLGEGYAERTGGGCRSGIHWIFIGSGALSRVDAYVLIYLMPHVSLIFIQRLRNVDLQRGIGIEGLRPTTILSKIRRVSASDDVDLALSGSSSTVWSNSSHA